MADFDDERTAALAAMAEKVSSGEADISDLMASAGIEMPDASDLDLGDDLKAIYAGIDATMAEGQKHVNAFNKNSERLDEIAKESHDKLHERLDLGNQRM